MTNIRKTLYRSDGAAIAYHKSEGSEPGVIFLGGFMSDMEGTKAVALETHCQKQGRAYLRFDYQGHGQSSGAFTDGTIESWSEDALYAIDQLTSGPQILVGSSMGGWIMMLVALARPSRIAGLVGIAAAPDFTESLMWKRFPTEIKKILIRDKIYYQPSEFSESPYPITLNLIENGRKHLLLQEPLDIRCPVHLLQGIKDESVPRQHAIEISRALLSDCITVTLIKSGDHRLSRDADLKKILTALDNLAI